MIFKYHNFLCKTCDLEQRHFCSVPEKSKQKCKDCGGDLISEVESAKGDCATFIPFKEGWYEHFTSEPIYIKNKQELKDACTKHNMGSVYRDDM